ncbi:hypothetical protein TNCV_4142651 [Trichonephila clavipes]|nr:hypothetical protein TNCV_4142651 [Trichonephila clavipes]
MSGICAYRALFFRKAEKTRRRKRIYRCGRGRGQRKAASYSLPLRGVRGRLCVSFAQPIGRQQPTHPNDS